MRFPSVSRLLAKEDEQFDAVAADPQRRRARIAELTRRRGVLFWAAMVSIVCAVAGKIGQSAGGVLPAVFVTLVLLKTESDLRLLRVIDCLEMTR